MSVRDPLKIRKGLLAGAVALTLTGAGVAFAWAADSPQPSPSQSAPGQENRPAKPDKSQRPQHLHSEGVVKKADGTFQTVLEQRGTVESVSDTSITVKSEDGYSQTYAVNAETKIKKVPAPAAGDTVRISGVRNGDQALAERIVEGVGEGPGLGLGRGHDKGHGHEKGHGKRHAK